MTEIASSLFIGVSVNCLSKLAELLSIPHDEITKAQKALNMSIKHTALKFSGFKEFIELMFNTKDKEYLLELLFSNAKGASNTDLKELKDRYADYYYYCKNTMTNPTSRYPSNMISFLENNVANDSFDCFIESFKSNLYGLILSTSDQFIVNESRNLANKITSDMTDLLSIDDSHLQVSMTDLMEMANKQRIEGLSIIKSAISTKGKIADNKYIEALYAARTLIENKLNSFLDGGYGTFAVVGEAGMGKTNFMCNAADKLSQHYPVLFFNGMEINGSLVSDILEQFKQINKSISFNNIISILKHEIKSPLLIFIDAINECSASRDSVRIELNKIAHELSGSQVKIIISCRTLDWDFWLRNDNGMVGYFGRSIMPNDAEASRIEIGYSIGEFLEEEFNEAWIKYKNGYNLVGDLSPAMKDICIEPFMLRLVAEIYRDGKPIPDYIEPLQLFDRYVKEKFISERLSAEVKAFLFWTAEYILHKQVPRVRIQDIPAESTEIFHKLLDEKIFIYKHGIHMHFHFELFLEFIIAQYLIESVSCEDIDGVVSFIEGLTKSNLINMPGIIENILVRIHHDSDLTAAACLNQLINMDDRWKAISISAIRKISFPGNSLNEMIIILARDRNYVLRLFLSHSLKSVNKSLLRPLLLKLQQDTDWIARETAANIMSFSSQLDDDSFSAILILMDDYHWRVRRAAGYALRNWLIRNDDKSRLIKQQLYDSINNYSWKTKYSICIALSNLTDYNDIDIAILKIMSMDKNRQVRWAIANYLDRYSLPQIATIIDVLSTDSDIWIRGRLIISLCRMARSSEIADTTLNKLSLSFESDMKTIFSRNCLAIIDKKWVIMLLQNYLREYDCESFAAAYSLILINKADDSLLQKHNNYKLMILRERIARKDMDLSSTLFAKTHEYISRRTEFSQFADPYMEVIDTICSLIARSIEIVTNDNDSLITFLDLLVEDVDEAVRWALVIYITDYAHSIIPQELRLRYILRLANDTHWWIRREVAISLRKVLSIDNQFALDTLNKLIEREAHLSEDCRDEIMHHANETINYILDRQHD